MKRVFGNCLLALGLLWLLALIWLTSVRMRTNGGIEHVPVNWGGILLRVTIIAAMIWAGVALRRSGAKVLGVLSDRRGSLGTRRPGA
jgi:hypothetical protein